MTSRDDYYDDYYELRCIDLQDALRPFAALTHNETTINDPTVPDHALLAGMSYTAGDYRKARAALKGKKP